jgi:hypothetical protein
MEAYFIDAKNKSVSVVDYDGNYKSISKIIGCDIFTVVNINNDGDHIFIDDEGLIIEQDDQNYFWFDGYPQMLAGNGLVLGTDREGDSIEPCQSIDWVRERVRFQDKETAPLYMPDLEPKFYTFE